MGKICYIMGKSSSGKDTIFKKLKEILPQFRTIILYTTRPIRAGETDGVEYYFTDEAKLESLEKQGAVIEMRAYHTKCGVWKYFTADDGQIDLEKYDYIVIGTLQSYEEMRLYFGKDRLVPVYIEVEDGERLSRALMRERQQSEPKYSEMCRRFLADQEDFSEENLENAGIIRRFQNNNMEECIQEIQMYLERERDEG
ncbi:MAG: guanylate kinase [Clostridium sp.]|nr:guanylate kinase [Clostridium sp.]